MGRNRSAGWQHAKLSGHKNEDLVKNRLDIDRCFQNSFLERVNKAFAKIEMTSVGGLHETNVPSIHGRTTKSKTDLKVYLDIEEVVNVSIKKSDTGQVYIVSAEVFIDTFEKQFDRLIPDDVQRAINLFWAAADDAVEIIEDFGDRNKARNYNLQMKHKSLNATTLRSYNEDLYEALLEWFSDNAYEITKLSFSMGAACDQREWCDFVWYINLLDENDMDDLFFIEDICEAAQAVAYRETYYGSVFGGTTIQLPFGSVQWHQRKLQFRHDYEKIKRLVDG